LEEELKLLLECEACKSWPPLTRGIKNSPYMTTTGTVPDTQQLPLSPSGLGKALRPPYVLYLTYRSWGPLSLSGLLIGCPRNKQTKFLGSNQK